MIRPKSTQVQANAYRDRKNEINEYLDNQKEIIKINMNAMKPAGVNHQQFKNTNHHNNNVVSGGRRYNHFLKKLTTDLNVDINNIEKDFESSVKNNQPRVFENSTCSNLYNP